MLEFSFSGEVIYWRGPSPFHFVEIPTKQSAKIKEISSSVTYGWGVIPVVARIGKTEWTTSLFPKNGIYLLPIKDAIRKAEAIELGEKVAVKCEIAMKPISRDI